MLRKLLTRLATGAAVLAAITLPSVASAHMGSTKALELKAQGATVDLTARVSSTDAAIALSLGTEVTAWELARHGQLLGGWVTRGIHLSDAQGACIAQTVAPSVRDEQLEVAVRYECTSGSGLSLRDDTIFADDPEHRVFVTWRGGDTPTTLVLDAEHRSVALPDQPSAAATALAFVQQGAIHLLTGYDHLLFLLSLLLVAGLGIRRDGFRPVLTDVATVVTAFTLGHSASLVAAALGWVALPSAWVEAGIAASIVLVAGLNLARPDAPTQKTRRVRALIAGAFGLVHGFGFSSVLQDVGLPAADRLVALASFNVGIELAQLVCVGAVLLPLGLWARRPSYRRYAVQGGSFAIAACGCVWLVERTFAL